MAVDKTIDNTPPPKSTSKRKALYAEFVKEVNTELPVRMPIEQIFRAVSAKARNRPTPRAGARPRHDLWLSAWRHLRQDSWMRILGLGATARTSIPTLFLILIGVFLLLQFARRHHRRDDGADGRRRA